MSTYRVVLNAVFFLAGCGLSAWFMPWLIDRRAYKDGFYDGWRAHRDAVEEESAFGPPVDLTERIKQYTRVDPPSADYPTY